MFKKIKHERGQAIIVIVFAIIGLLGLTALAIDGGNAFADRRRAQSAADNAALAAALSLVQSEDYQAAGLSMAATNGYANDGAYSIVAVSNNPMGAGCNGVTPTITLIDADDRLEYYLLVVIRSNVDTYFGPVIGVDQVHNCVQSIVRAKPGIYTALALGSAVAAVDCTGEDTVAVSSASAVTLIDGGLFSNSSDPQAAYVQKLSNLSSPNISAVGGVSVPTGNTIPTSTGLEQFPCPLPEYMIPEYTCDYEYEDFPPASTDENVTVSGGMTTLSPGVYCISGTFPKTDMTGDGVTFVMLNEGITWNGNTSIHLTSPTSGTTKGLLMYFPYGNTNTIRLNGTAGLDIIGSVFAPDATIILQGDFGSSAIQSQWVGKTVDMTGSLVATFQYNESRSYEFPAPPEIELTK